jgi:cell division initiation protein
MDVTPHDLRNAELREAFRGYRPDEVEELLERAAITLERMHERNRVLQERLSQVENEASSGREMESVLRQTLLLAQRTADETVTSAHERARQLLEEAEDRALRLTTEAEEQARTTGEAQRQKYETIVTELASRREMLTEDIDALERVQADYRGRLRAVLEKELQDLDRRSLLPSPARPELAEINLSDPAELTVESGETKNGNGPHEAASDAAPDASSGEASSGEEADGGPPTEALVVLEEELAESGPPGPAGRRRP